jgi:hypothetical protein
MSFRKLFTIVPPPETPKETGSPKAWEKIDQRLGLTLPQDYKDIIDHYGTGTFNNFITLYNPFAENESLNLFHALETHHRASQMAQHMIDSPWTALHPFELYPAHQGLLPWGMATSFEKIFFWQIKGAPKNWNTIFYNLRNGEYEVWKIPCADFLEGIFTGTIQSVLLPEFLPSNSGAFVFQPHQEVTL